MAFLYAFLQCVPDPDGQGDVLPGEGFAETHSGCQQKRMTLSCEVFSPWFSRRTVPGEAETNRFSYYQLLPAVWLQDGVDEIWIWTENDR